MKFYGCAASAATDVQIREAVADAGAEADRAKRSVGVGAAPDGRLAIDAGGPADRRDGGDRLSIVACTAQTNGEYSGSEAWETYDLDGAASIALDCLARGIIRYGSIGFLSEGRHQLLGAMKDARRTIQRLGGWYILGRTRDKGIMLAPASMSDMFVAPQSFYVGRLGAWTVSRLHSCRVSWIDYTGAGRAAIVDVDDLNRARSADAEYAMGLPRRRDGAADAAARPEAKKEAPARPHDTLAPVDLILYEAIGYRMRKHGRLGSDRSLCLLQLENAIEDAAALGASRKRTSAIGISGEGAALLAGRVSSPLTGPPAATIKIDPDELRYGGPDGEFAAAVADAARRAYDRLKGPPSGGG